MDRYFFLQFTTLFSVREPAIILGAYIFGFIQLKAYIGAARIPVNILLVVSSKAPIKTTILYHLIGN